MEQINTISHKRNVVFDITKYVLSLMIIAIHSGLFPNYLYPWLSLAVPLFFIISSYFLFSKIHKRPLEKDNILKNFIKRNLYLYLFWFIVSLPFIVVVRKSWWTGDVLLFLFTVIKNLIFSSTFTASWFIVASVWAAFILCKIKLPKKLAIPILFIIYILCCIKASYWNLLPDGNFIKVFLDAYTFCFTSPVFSFPMALVWMYIGKVFAVGGVLRKYDNRFYYVVNMFLIIIFSIALFFEWKFACSYNDVVSMGMLFFLLPLSISIFTLLKNIEIYKDSKLIKFLNIESIISYPLHPSVILVISFLGKFLSINIPEYIRFLLTVILCHVGTIVILLLEKFPKFKFLKYSH